MLLLLLLLLLLWQRLRLGSRMESGKPRGTSEEVSKRAVQPSVGSADNAGGVTESASDCAPNASPNLGHHVRASSSHRFTCATAEGF